jgi:prolyl-tRNA editing enzyme YbaK/EbsC (Cys-tRNA(Pro) deacylase)
LAIESYSNAEIYWLVEVRVGAKLVCHAMTQDTRYLEEVALGGQAYSQLAGIWVGEEEEHDGLSLRQESLRLNEDGTFTHTLAHRFAPMGQALRASENDNCESSCSGQWRLHNIRHFGADLAATATDRELKFQSAAGSRPVLVDKLIVCGANPAVNGFIGASCRLYPRNRFSNDGAQCRQQESSHEELDLDLQPTEEDAKQLAEATGRSLDACFAALFQAGSREEAAVLLLDNSADSPKGDELASVPPGATDGFELNTPSAPRALGARDGFELNTPSAPQAPGVDISSRPSNSGVTSETTSASAEAVAEATGRPLAQCAEALRAHSGKVNDAVDYLLSFPSSEKDSRAPSAADQVKAARLTELCGQPFEKCLDVLRNMNGNAERAAASLLGLEEGVVESSHAVPSTPEEIVVDAAGQTAIAVDIDAETASWETNNAVLRAAADVEASINAEVDAALGTAGDESPSPSSKRRRLD